MFIGRLLIPCIVVLCGVWPIPVSADLITINPEQVYTWKVSKDYRAELESIQGTEGVCAITLTQQHDRILTGARAVRLLTEDQLAVIHKMHRQLTHDASFKDGIAALIEQDAWDVHNRRVVPAEFGGLGIHVRGHIELLPIPSGGRLALDHEGEQASVAERIDSASNAKYVTPEWAWELIPYVFEWHMHSGTFSNADDLCTPSASFDEDLGWRSDVGFSLARMKADLNTNQTLGKTHSFLFAKVNHRKFSTVYFGGVMDKNEKWFITIVALPILEY